MDRHFISLLSAAMASPHIYFPGALLCCSGEKVITLFREKPHGIPKACKVKKLLLLKQGKKKKKKGKKGKKWKTRFWKLQQFSQGQL